MGKIFFLMGKSASGKDTIYKELQNRVSGLHTVLMYTTRPRRDGETDGVEYYFRNEDFLEDCRRSGRLIECRTYDTVYGPWSYFTVDDGQIDLGKYDYLVIGTLVSYRALRDYFGSYKLVPIYIEVEDGLRLYRALQRERKEKVPKYAEMCRRFLADSEDFSEDNLRKAGIERRFENLDLDACLEEINRYIEDFRV